MSCKNMSKFQYCLVCTLLLQAITCYAVEDHINDPQWIYKDVEALLNTTKPDKVKRSAGKLFRNISFLHLLNI